MYLGCVWKWIRSREQNSVPESGHSNLYSAQAIKMSRLAIDWLLILWSLHSSHHCRGTDCTFFCPYISKTLREDNSDAPETAPKTAPKIPVLLIVPICSHDRVCNRNQASTLIVTIIEKQSLHNHANFWPVSSGIPERVLAASLHICFFSWRSARCCLIITT